MYTTSHTPMRSRRSTVVVDEAGRRRTVRYRRPGRGNQSLAAIREQMAVTR